MKPLMGMEEMVLVHPGEDWPYPQNPCTREMMRILERNERFVTWLQPKTKGVADQVPAICVKVCIFGLHRRAIFKWFVAGQVLLTESSYDEVHLETCASEQGVYQYGNGHVWRQEAQDSQKSV